MNEIFIRKGRTGKFRVKLIAPNGEPVQNSCQGLDTRVNVFKNILATARMFNENVPDPSGLGSIKALGEAVKLYVVRPETVIESNDEEILKWLK